MKNKIPEKMQAVYNVACVFLFKIATYPDVVKSGALGCFMTIESLTSQIGGSMDPHYWFKNQYFEGEKISFENLPEEDQEKLKKVLENLIAPSISQRDLEEKCFDCGILCAEFDHKILETVKI